MIGISVLGLVAIGGDCFTDTNSELHYTGIVLILKCERQITFMNMLKTLPQYWPQASDCGENRTS